MLLVAFYLMSLSSSVYIELRKNRRFGKFTLLVSFFHLTVSQNQLLREVASLPQFFGLPTLPPLQSFVMQPVC